MERRATKKDLAQRAQREDNCNPRLGMTTESEERSLGRDAVSG
jgi:hypothetical protein